MVSGAVFLAGITGIFFLSGFSTTLSTLKKQNSVLFHKGLLKNRRNEDSGKELATRALKWGTLYSTVSCGFIFLSSWKLSGASSFEDFRQRMAKLLPRISRTNSFKGN